jgi:hypothetical protein
MFSGGTQHCSVTNSNFTDLSGSAVMLGQVNDWNEPNAELHNGNYMVGGNTISSTSLEYRGSPAVTAGYVMNTVIEHNLIANLSYSGVSLGWGWGREDSYVRCVRFRTRMFALDDTIWFPRVFT